MRDSRPPAGGPEGPPSPALRIGPFDLTEPIGRGGAGVVWSGSHRDSGVAVAVKVMHPHSSGPRSSGVHASFMNEVRSVAALDHPGIVWLFDAGEIDAATADASHGELMPASPYIVMEYASGGTLADFVPRTWDDVRTLLLGLLDALGHAHARHVVHRDLKPGNVLLGTVSDLRPGWKLTDFGIATAMEETQSRSIAQELVGTLLYMAPEQIKGEWREFGPWTDLYALGALVYRTVGDQRMFGPIRGPGLITAHLTAEPEPLNPRVPVPPGFARWVSKLLAKRIEDRYASAADAMRELVQLGSPSAVDAPRLLRPGEDDTSADEGPTELVSAPALGWRSVSRVPEDWRTGDVAPPPPGVGLTLFGLRTLPFVGRTDERDLLWDRFRRVVARGRADVVVIRGSPGVGKTRLARWLGESAHALAGVPYLLGEARAGEGPVEALSRPFRRWFRTVRLTSEQRAERLRRFLGSPRDDGVDAAAAFTAEGADEQSTLASEARYTAARQLLEHLAGPPHGVVLVLDDAHRSPDVLRFALKLLESQSVRPIPVALVLVVDQLGVAGVGDELAELLAHPGTTELPLGPLPREAHERLVQSMLPLEGSLASKLVDRTVGNPLHAVQIVRGWVSAHQLRAADGSYTLTDPERTVAPMPEVWRAHLKRLFEDQPPAARSILERGAVLGPVVDEDEWQRVCDDPQGAYAAIGRVNFHPETARIRTALRDRLLVERLVEDTDAGFVFVVELFRETLISLAEAAGRLPEHHQACARVLSTRPESRRQVERIGRHLVAGGKPAEALPYLVEAFRQRLRSSGDRAALPLLAELEDALRLAVVPDADLQWAELAARRAEVFVRLERLADARRAAADAEKRARVGGWRSLQARAAAVIGQVRLRHGDAEEADVALARAEGLLGEGRDPRLLGSIHAARSQCAEALGDRDAAKAHALEAARCLREAGHRRGLAEAWNVLGESALREGDFDQAEADFGQARELHLHLRSTVGVAGASLALGGVARARGDLEAARRWFSEALDRYREAGSPGAVHAGLGLARTELGRRDWVEAHRLAVDVLGRGAPPPGIELAVHAVICAAAAGMRDWPLFDVHVERVASRVAAEAPRDRDVGWCLRLAEARAEAASHESRARRVRKLVEMMGGAS